MRRGNEGWGRQAAPVHVLRRFFPVGPGLGPYVRHCKPIAYRCADVGQPWARHYVTHTARARVRGSGGGQGQGGHEDVPLHVTCADRCHA